MATAIIMIIENPKGIQGSRHVQSRRESYLAHRPPPRILQPSNAGPVLSLHQPSARRNRDHHGRPLRGPHRLGQYTELAEQIRKPVCFVLGNHDRYGTTFANAEAVVERVTTLFSHMVRLDGSQVIPLNKSVALVGVDGWADGLGGEGPATKARINDFYQILDFATEPEPQVFRQMKERARKYSQALKPSLIKALKQYQTTIIATHVPPYEGAAWHEGSPSSPDYQPFFSSPTMGNMIKAAAAEHPGKSVLVLLGLMRPYPLARNLPRWEHFGAHRRRTLRLPRHN